MNNFSIFHVSPPSIFFYVLHGHDASGLSICLSGSHALKGTTACSLFLTESFRITLRVSAMLNFDLDL
jgi:hypothetical protein